jgi:hypothetical protein
MPTPDMLLLTSTMLVLCYRKKKKSLCKSFASPIWFTSTSILLWISSLAHFRSFFSPTFCRHQRAPPRKRQLQLETYMTPRHPHLLLPSTQAIISRQLLLSPPCEVDAQSSIHPTKRVQSSILTIRFGFLDSIPDQYSTPTPSACCSALLFPRS